jgi:hypothetical protein
MPSSRTGTEPGLLRAADTNPGSVPIREGQAAARSGVGGTYNRASYTADARVALQAWADWLDSLNKPAGQGDNVVRLRPTG